MHLKIAESDERTPARLPSTDSHEQRLSIALVVHDLHKYGGHSVYTRILADGLSRRHDVAVFANRCDRPSEALWQHHHAAAWRGSALSTVHTFPLGLRAQSALLGKYQIRHMQGYCGGDPNVVTAHICVQAYLDSLREASVRSRASLKLMAATEKHFYRGYQKQVIAISEKVAGELRSYYQFEGPIKVVPHGVDPEPFTKDQRASHRESLRSELGLKKASVVALYAGDLTKAHAHLKAVAEAAPNVQFVIVTSSRQYHWQAANVRILPSTTRLNRYYAAADAFVFPTSYDAFGMVILEAMASGLPVFSSDCAGAAELITSGKDGYVIPLTDWVEVTATALGDRSALRSIGIEAEKTALKHDWAKVVDEVEKVYFETASS